MQLSYSVAQVTGHPLPVREQEKLGYTVTDENRCPWGMSRGFVGIVSEGARVKHKTATFETSDEADNAAWELWMKYTAFLD